MEKQLKSLLALTALVLLLALPAKADIVSVGDVLKDLPALKQGVAWSLIDNKLNYLSTVELVHIGKYVNIEGGYAGAAENTGNKIVGVLSVNLIDSGYINYPILKYVKFNPGVYAGFGSINLKALGDSEFDWGVSATVFEVKF